jgi:carbamate kinase
MAGSDSQPLLIIALGGNALSPPARGGEGYADERRIVAETASTLRDLARQGHRLLIVHGNGPQVGRLLRTDPEPGNLDIHVAQTQGELGYLLANELAPEPVVGLLTRVVVAAALGAPVKPIGPILAERPRDAASAPAGSGWRITVPSPKPARIVEIDAVAQLLKTSHVVAGGGGGVPLDEEGSPLECVVDKDWVASLFAVGLQAERLVFATDVPGVYPDPERRAEPIAQLTVADARQLLDAGAVTQGSMAPKLASAVEFVSSVGRRAGICDLDSLAAFAGGDESAGTLITP